MYNFAVSTYTVFGVLWALLIAQFIIFEIAAILLAKKMSDGDDTTKYDGVTLSEYTWRLTKRNSLIFFIFAGFLTWLVAHLLFEV